MADTQRRATVTLDQDAALVAAPGSLAREFDGIYGRETINRFLHDSYD